MRAVCRPGAIENFLGTISYPLYYLDFETYQQAIPEYDGIRPYMQIPFQYSLHIQDKQGGEPVHREFLAAAGTDPRPELVKRLCEDIPPDACVMAYNIAFEKSVIRQLAETYPAYQNHLMAVHENFVDLMKPFSTHAYYCKEFHGSYSIKAVLPALCPEDPELDYNALDGIHNGGEAMTAFATIAALPKAEVERIRTSLLAYCRLDTLAMAKILDALRRMISEPGNTFTVSAPR
jgi:hypothetical protein